MIFLPRSPRWLVQKGLRWGRRLWDFGAGKFCLRSRGLGFRVIFGDLGFGGCEALQGSEQLMMVILSPNCSCVRIAHYSIISH